MGQTGPKTIGPNKRATKRDHYKRVRAHSPLHGDNKTLTHIRTSKALQSTKLILLKTQKLISP